MVFVASYLDVVGEHWDANMGRLRRNGGVHHKIEYIERASSWINPTGKSQT